jgi:hypothetical protein
MWLLVRVEILKIPGNVYLHRKMETLLQFKYEDGSESLNAKANSMLLIPNSVQNI